MKTRPLYWLVFALGGLLLFVAALAAWTFGLIVAICLILVGGLGLADRPGGRRP